MRAEEAAVALSTWGDGCGRGRMMRHREGTVTALTPTREEQDSVVKRSVAGERAVMQATLERASTLRATSLATTRPHPALSTSVDDAAAAAVSQSGAETQPRAAAYCTWPEEFDKTCAILAYHHFPALAERKADSRTRIYTKS